MLRTTENTKKYKCKNIIKELTHAKHFHKIKVFYVWGRVAKLQQQQKLV